MDTLEQYFRDNRRKHVNAIYRVVNNYATAEDIVQDAFVHSLQHIKSYDEKKGKFGNWFSRILYQKLGMFLRLPAVVSIEVMKEEEEWIDYTNIIDNFSSFTQLIKDIDKTLFRQIIKLHYIQGYPQKDIPALTGVSLSTVNRVCQFMKV